MNDRAETIAEPDVSLPPILSAEPATPPLDKRPWYGSVGPALLGLFVWAPFFDQLWVADITRHSVAWLAASAVLSSLLCFGVFLTTAGWGMRARRPLSVVAASTFGAAGSEWIAGVAIALANIVWYAVAIDYAVDSTLFGLRACGLMRHLDLQASHIGPLAVHPPVYLCTALFWIYITGTAVLLRLPGVVVALMRVYAPIAFLLLTAVGLYSLRLAGSFRALDPDALLYASYTPHVWRGGVSAPQLICGFFAMASLVSIDWGAVTRSRRDLVLGGLTGIFGAGSWTAVMSLLAVAATVPPLHIAGTPFEHGTMVDPIPFSFRWAVYRGVGGLPAGVILVLFGLAALAPAVYSAWSFSERLSAHWPVLRPSLWTWIGAGAGFVLIATSCAGHLGLIYSAMGDFFAPAAGALAGDCLRQRGRWHGARPGINPPGIIAWASGCGLAVILEAGSIMDPGRSAWLQPASIYGFAAAAAVYWVAARSGLERAAVPVHAEGVEHDQD